MPRPHHPSRPRLLHRRQLPTAPRARSRPTTTLRRAFALEISAREQAVPTARRERRDTEAAFLKGLWRARQQDRAGSQGVVAGDHIGDDLASHVASSSSSTLKLTKRRYSGTCLRRYARADDER